MPEKLCDVKCQKCDRVIGKRDGKSFHQFNMNFIFDRSGKITCPFEECKFENVFRVNRDNKQFDNKIIIDKTVSVS